MNDTNGGPHNFVKPMSLCIKGHIRWSAGPIISPGIRFSHWQRHTDAHAKRHKTRAISHCTHHTVIDCSWVSCNPIEVQSDRSCRLCMINDISAEFYRSHRAVSRGLCCSLVAECGVRIYLEVLTNTFPHVLLSEYVTSNRNDGPRYVGVHFICKVLPKYVFHQRLMAYK